MFLLSAVGSKWIMQHKAIEILQCINVKMYPCRRIYRNISMYFLPTLNIDTHMPTYFSSYIYLNLWFLLVFYSLSIYEPSYKGSDLSKRDTNKLVDFVFFFCCSFDCFLNLLIILGKILSDIVRSDTEASVGTAPLSLPYLNATPGHRTQYNLPL